MDLKTRHHIARTLRAAAKVLARGAVTLPKGSTLFHGSYGEFSRLRPGGDQVVWFSDAPGIAQLYIPALAGGGEIFMTPSLIAREDDHWSIPIIRKFLNIEGKWPDAREIEALLKKLGFEEAPNMRGWYVFQIDDDKVLPPGLKHEGRLYVGKTKRDMKLWLKATGEADYLDIQYEDLSGFRDAEKAGLDGVIIDDLAQSKEHGNLSHLSVGLFKSAIKDVAFKVVPAGYEEIEWGKGDKTEAYPLGSKSYFYKLVR